MKDQKEHLWLIAQKLYGIGELLKNWNGEPLGSGDCPYGIGAIITDLAAELMAVWEEVDSADQAAPSSEGE